VSGFKREVTTNMLLGGGVARHRGGGHEDCGLSPSLIKGGGNTHDRPAVLVARRREGWADADAASPPSSLLSYHSPFGSVVRPVVRDCFWQVLEVDAGYDNGDGKK
jgi:hypothetical protein